MIEQRSMSLTSGTCCNIASLCPFDTRVNRALSANQKSTQIMLYTPSFVRLWTISNCFIFETLYAYSVLCNIFKPSRHITLYFPHKMGVQKLLGLKTLNTVFLQRALDGPGDAMFYHIIWLSKYKNALLYARSWEQQITAGTPT